MPSHVYDIVPPPDPHDIPVSDHGSGEENGLNEKLEFNESGRASTERRARDRETLDVEEEAERLLAGEDGGLGRRYQASGRDKGRNRVGEESWIRGKRWKSGPREKDDLDENGEAKVLYAIEDGTRRRSSGESARSLSSEGSQDDLARLKTTQERRKSKRSRWVRFLLVHTAIVLAFLGLLFGAYRASKGLSRKAPQQESKYKPQHLSNGTHTFAPTTILISLDGFRADFLNRGLTPTLSSFIRNGVSPKYMLPSFPSLTFPNHFTLVTGLYPESHGIVGNTFWDPETEKEFYYTDPARSMTPEWWQGEPIWETAELAGVRTAIHMWPGSEAHIGTHEPTYVDKFNGDEALGNKVNRILTWLDTPGPDDANCSEETPRPQLIAAYVPNVDADGHAFGPNSTYIRSTITEADGMLNLLFTGLADRNLTDIVNIIVVSDHGMATTSTSRLIQLEDLLDPSLIAHTDGWPLYGLRPYNTSETHLTALAADLTLKSQLPQYRNAFRVHLRDTTMPTRYHFSFHPRIAPLWLVPSAGWAIVTHDEFDVAAALKSGRVYSPRGLHGYDHEHPLMRAIFAARGPAFPHEAGSEVAPFGNTEVYNIVCDSLGIVPRKGNGTLRLPLTTLGLHDFGTVEDEVDFDNGAEVDGDVVQILPSGVIGVGDGEVGPPAATSPADGGEAGSENDYGKEEGKVDPVPGEEKGKGGLFAWIKEKFHDLQAWIAGEAGDDTAETRS